MTPTVLLVTGDTGHGEAFATAAGEIVDVELIATCELSHAAHAVERHRPSVVVVDHEGAAHAETVIAPLIAADPTLAVLLWAAPGSEEGAAADALRLGCRDVLPRPLAVEDAATRIRAAAAWSERVRDQAASTGRPPDGEVVAVFGAKGGVGTSSLAVQLARLAATAGSAPVLVDLDLAGPDLTSLLDVAHHRTILDLVPVAGHLDDRYLTDALRPHRSGMRLLLGAAEGERADELDDRTTRQIVTALRANAPVTIIDCGSRLDDATAVALELADHALLVVTPDVPCLLAGRRHLAALERLAIRTPDRVQAVLNRHRRTAEVPPAAVGRALGIDVAATVPHRAAFTAAAADARPELVDDGPSRRALTGLARTLDLVPTRPPRTWWPVRRGHGGQASVEFLGILPLLLAIALLTLQGLVTTSAAASAQDAARAGARAAARGGDATEAVQAELPGWLADQPAEVQVRRTGDQVHVEVRVRPPGPGRWIGTSAVTGEATFAIEEG